MNRLTPVFFCLGVGLILGAPDARSQVLEPLFWGGHLENADGPINGPTDMTFTVFDADGEVVSERRGSITLTEGDFVVELEVINAEGLTLGVQVGSVPLLPQAPLPVAWPSAAIAEVADIADGADDADAVGAITDPLTLAQLASPGGVAIPLINFIDFPVDFIDGDQGLDFTAGSTLSFTAGTLAIRPGALSDAHVGSITNVDLADGTLRSADVADGTVGTSKLSSIPLSKVQNGTLTGRHFAGTETTLFEVTEAGCSQPLNTLTIFSTCSFSNTGSCPLVVAGMPATGKLDCTGRCVLGSVSSCENTPAGVLVLP